MSSISGGPMDVSSSRASKGAQKRKASDQGDGSSRKKQKPQANSPSPRLPLPTGQPPVYSKIRAALCDSIDFWKAHQGGIQSTDKVATGMLLNGKTTPRDIIGAQVIITTVGSGNQIATDGKHIRTDNQSTKSKNYVILTNAMRMNQPVGIVVGKQSVEKGRYANNLLNVELANHFNVLDWFFITDIWSERQPTQRDGSSFMHYMVRLQSINLETVPWWLPQGHQREGMHAIGEFHCNTITCESCGTSSKEIFKEGWCCLEHTCAKFFEFSSPAVDINAIQYNENFLNERIQWSSEREVDPLAPALPVLEANCYGSEKAFKRGIVCPTCKIASRRLSWEGWECEKKCGFKLSMPPRDVPMAIINQETQDAFKKKTKFFRINEGIVHTAHDVPGYEVTSFYLPNVPQNLQEGQFIGSVTVFRPTAPTRERKGGLDDLFLEVQEATRVGSVNLRRYPAFCKGSHMEELTSQFSCNMGADYKFGVVVETSNDFNTAPDPVMKALSRLTWGGATAVQLTAGNAAENNLSVDSSSMPNHFIDFNEQLMLGYFENSQISYHDDGEKELGPTVATLSLGSPSVMNFRAKKKADFGDKLRADRVLLSFVVEHGDLVIMHGTKIHKYYDHAVTAGGIRRYALTCRYIRPEMIPDPVRRQKAIANGAVPPHWQKQAYKGESMEELNG
ncbi:hypothetical protein NUW58_g5117 [Xylaria curta]|uniref:Uncharacterized protein n=1 Tax=Xylaria curta TaxID=42375 RepID=A0ACC1P5P6_9PEZI|nr:hypothetical protein NUW58_g5117 [Xylaria curta]